MTSSSLDIHCRRKSAHPPLGSNGQFYPQQNQLLSATSSKSCRKSVGVNKSQFCLSIPDIEQPLTRRNLIKPTNCFPKQAKDFNLHVVKTFNEVVDLALHRHADAVNPFQELEHPTQGWPLGWLVDLVW